MAPDLIATNSLGFRAGWQDTLGGIASAVVEPNQKRWSGDHCSLYPLLVPGILFSNQKLNDRQALHGRPGADPARPPGVESQIHFNGRSLLVKKLTMKLNLLGGVLVGLFSNLVFYLASTRPGSCAATKAATSSCFASAAHAAALILVLSRHRSNALPAAIPSSSSSAPASSLSFVAGLVTALGSWIFTTQVDPTYLGWVVEQTAAHLKTLELPASRAAAASSPACPPGSPRPATPPRA